MIRITPRTTRTDTLFPYTTRVRSRQAAVRGKDGRRRRGRRTLIHRIVAPREEREAGGRLRSGWRKVGRQPALRAAKFQRERKSVVWGKSEVVRVDVGGGRLIKNKKTLHTHQLL